MPGDDTLIEQPFILHIFVAAAVILAGFYVSTNMLTVDDLYAISDSVIKTNRINANIVAEIMRSLISMEDKMRGFVLMLALRGLSYINVVYIVIFGTAVGNIEAAISKNGEIYDTPPSVTSYHASKNILPACFLHMPLFYMAIPVEHFMKTGPDTLKYLIAITNAVMCYFVFYSLKRNKPQTM